MTNTPDPYISPLEELVEMPKQQEIADEYHTPR